MYRFDRTSLFIWRRLLLPFQQKGPNLTQNASLPFLFGNPPPVCRITSLFSWKMLPPFGDAGLSETRPFGLFPPERFLSEMKKPLPFNHHLFSSYLKLTPS